MRTTTIVLGALGAFTTLARADDGGDDAPTRELGTVTVTATRPSSLPTQIPTTIEGITGDLVAQTINATDSEDALKYFPSLLVRKRYIGDYDHAVLATRASGTGNSARSLVYADGILISNLLGNGATFTPRWGLVTPEEIERVDVLYGPFSAAYPGNSVGAVVDYVTRMPDELEMHVKLGSFGQDFAIYDSSGRFTGWQASASAGDRSGNFSWWLNFNRLDSDGQPLSFANKLVSTGIAGGAGTPVTGALADRNPRNQDWLILGSTSQIDTVQDHAKAKLSYDFSPTLRASYTLAVWHNDAVRSSESYLRDGAGNAVYSGAINVDGRSYTRDADRFRAEPRRSHAPDAGPVDPVARARTLGLGNLRQRVRLRGRHRARTDRCAARRGIRRRRTHHRSGRHRLARARAARHVAPGQRWRTRDRSRRATRRLPPADPGLGYARLDRRRRRESLFGLSRPDRVAGRVCAGQLAFRQRLARHASACAWNAGRPRMARSRTRRAR